MKPTRKKGSKAKPRILPLEVNVDEYVLLLYSLKYLRHKVGVMLAFESGMRISEITNLKPEDFDFKNKEIRINQGKNSKDRYVPLPLSWQKHHINYIPLPCKQRALQKAFILASEKTEVERIAFLIDECKAMDIEVLPPNINESDITFAVVNNEKIRFGLEAIKNVGHNIVTSIVNF